MTHHSIPPVAYFRDMLRELTQKQLNRLSNDTGVPYGTLIHIRHERIKNPSYESIRKALPRMEQMREHYAAERAAGVENPAGDHKIPMPVLYEVEA